MARRHRIMSQRELEVLKWIALGKDDSVIAGLLGISKQELNRHIHDISIQLHANNRVEAGLQAIKMGLV